MPLTTRQQEILDLIRRHIAQTGHPPTRAEIAQEFGFRSANAAEDHLTALARKGAIALQRGASRGIRLLEPLEGSDEGLPVVGQVAAGQPILAQEHLEDRYRIDPGLFRPRAHYLLRVRGMSMRDAGILDGDLLAVHQTPEGNDGQILVVRVDEEVTVKRLRRDPRRPERLELWPENPEFAPIEVDLRRQSLVIEGLGVGVIRNDPAAFGQRCASAR
jgi:repressor LexA